MPHALVHGPSHLDFGLRWLARITGLLILAIFVSFLIGEGLDPSKLTPTESLLMIALFASIAGLAIGWHNEAAGGALNVGGILAFYAMHFAATGRVPGGPAFLLIAVPGVLLLVCWWRTTRRQ